MLYDLIGSRKDYLLLIYCSTVKIMYSVAGSFPFCSAILMPEVSSLLRGFYLSLSSLSLSSLSFSLSLLSLPLSPSLSVSVSLSLSLPLCLSLLLLFARGLNEKKYCTYSFTLVNKKINRSFVRSLSLPLSLLSLCVCLLFVCLFFARGVDEKSIVLIPFPSLIK